MRLIKIEALGFKSFAEKINLSFDGGIVGIVGPNGAGKSNINDAIKWALGESSAKSLRGDKMEDVIFSGSQGFMPMKSAKVSLTFDNSNNLDSSIKHKVFTISREMIRNTGENNYYINDQIARLKDIRSIAMESGIGKSSLAIISQGTISQITEANPQERRIIFEEAAGISKYKQKKLESLRKLERTTESLEKINTIVRELEKQIAPLKKQVEKAKIYLTKKEELKKIEISLIVKDVLFYEKELVKLNEKLKNVFANKNDINEKIEKIEKQIKNESFSKIELDKEINKLNQQNEDLIEKINVIELKNSQLHQWREMVISGQIKNPSQEKLKVLKEEIEDLRKKIIQFNDWEVKNQKIIEDKQIDLSKFKSQIEILDSKINTSNKRLIESRSKIEILSDYKVNKSNLFKGTKTVFENKNLFAGFQGIVADLIKVDSKYKIAIETILKNALQHIVVDNSDTAINFINFLKKNNSGRATFIPLNVIKSKNVINEHLMICQNIKDFEGVASDLVQIDSKLLILKQFLLGNVLITKNIDAAKQISQTLEQKYMVVTLDGDVIKKSAILSGGAKANVKELLGLEEQIAAFKKVLPKYEQEIKQYEQEIIELKNQVDENEKFIKEVSIELAKRQQQKQNYENNFLTFKNQYESETNEKLKFDEKIKMDDSEEKLKAEKSSLQVLLKTKQKISISLNKNLTELTFEKNKLEKNIRVILEDSANQISEQKQMTYIVENSKKRLAEEYELVIEEAAKKYSLKDEKKIEKSRDNVDKLRKEIKELGYVNVNAIETFKAINERYEKLSKDQQEVADAQKVIFKAIDEMDQIIISKLDQTVKNINKEINVVFKSMFGGGHAQVKYVDPKNILESGIEVIAQPPGKTIKKISLFSGGEKSLVTISLLFAILKSKPLPLCVLDEVEAQLDESNVVRFANYLQSLKKNTQFIVATHRIGTMARVDYLVGVTMQNKGITKIFSVDLQTAKKMVDQ